MVFWVLRLNEITVSVYKSLNGVFFPSPSVYLASLINSQRDPIREALRTVHRTFSAWYRNVLQMDLASFSDSEDSHL